MLLTARRNIPLRYFYLSLLSLFICLQFCSGSDAFCGNLTVYRRKWSLENAVVLVSRITEDLKRCLHVCCSLTDCQGVTFIGVVEKLAQENCLLIKCDGECLFDTITEFSEGVSVKITRAKQNSTLDDIEATDTSLSSKAADIFTSKLTPIWAIALIIVASVLCIGFNVVVISAYICWRKKKSHKRKAHISTITALHAFNPT
ncbi:unnamed protein product [Cercopithifilaria johnstoni]|uniref:Seven cysteines N-terminal domain-containing protein n=1 Tax=Cercopithifilaria johnstoni TaxID=2874296 RepID=A0A8J2Q0Z4_9BILA|nr:unnamed protein product [Cercopithifilaria johnstoni]